MSLKFCSLGSGSGGNCVYVGTPSTTILIDVGLPFRRIEKSLAVIRANLTDVNVLLTHEHYDHVSNLLALRKSISGDTYASEETAQNLSKGGIRLNYKTFRGEFFIGDIAVRPFNLSHDVPCVGFSVAWRGKKVSVLTDTGKVDRGVLRDIADSDIVMIESNHDVDMLMANTKYPYPIKKRILSDRGHLSNDACADVVEELCRGGVKQIILAHLSKENNYPELAYNTVYDRLSFIGYDDVKIEVARQDGMSGLYEVL